MRSGLWLSDGPRRFCGVLTAGLLVAAFGMSASPPADAKAKISQRQLERSLKAHLEEKEQLKATQISKCRQRRHGRVYVCRWKAAGLFPGEIPYKCSDKARFLAAAKRWRAGECVNELEPMVPLLAELGPHPVFGYNDDWTGAEDHNPRINMLRAVGAEVARWPVRWDQIEASPGSYYWYGHDFIRQQFYQYGVRPLVVVVGTPCWAQAGECEPLGHPSPEHYDDMAAFAATVARRYDEAIGIEVWNEPNLAKFWGGEPDPTAYGEMLNHVAPAIHEANPNMPVVSAGLAPHGTKDESGDGVAAYLSAAYATGGPQQADAIGAHPYPFKSYGEDYLGAIRTELYHYLEVMARFGEGGKPIWVTETGVANDEGFSLAQQADALARMYVLFRRIANVPVVVFHRFVDRAGAEGKENSYGVIQSSGQPKPALCAVATAREVPC